MKSRLLICIALTTALLGSQVSRAATIPFSKSRPFNLFVPTTYNASTPSPLVIGLSGYNQTGAQFEKYLKLTPIAQADGFLYVHPDGSKDSHGIRFWNGTPECCNFYNPKVDDAAYIMSIVDAVSAAYAVDANRIYIIGYSNGGFLANNLACRYADRIAGIVNISGGSYTSSAACSPSAPISVLEIWGTNDETYKINHILGKPIPGAMKIFTTWGAINNCIAPARTSPTKLDLDVNVLGPETSVVQFQGCPASTAIDFWKMVGAGHAPKFSKDFPHQIMGWLLTHLKVPVK
ncbi:MAG: PHB depolymerase family esterase [Actinomycetes bacterium]